MNKDLLFALLLFFLGAGLICSSLPSSSLSPEASKLGSGAPQAGAVVTSSHALDASVIKVVAGAGKALKLSRKGIL